MPPRVDAEGFGRRAAGSVPLVIFAALVASMMAEADREIHALSVGPQREMTFVAVLRNTSSAALHVAGRLVPF